MEEKARYRSILLTIGPVGLAYAIIVFVFMAAGGINLVPWYLTAALMMVGTIWSALCIFLVYRLVRIEWFVSPPEQPASPHEAFEDLSVSYPHMIEEQESRPYRDYRYGYGPGFDSTIEYEKSLLEMLEEQEHG